MKNQQNLNKSKAGIQNKLIVRRLMWKNAICFQGICGYLYTLKMEHYWYTYGRNKCNSYI